jgi:phage tail-like protein
MAKYGINYYGSSKYGATPKLIYSVEPMSITVLTFNTVSVNWQTPVGDFTRIRLIRNQNGFPEHAEDGVTIWEEYATQGTVTRTSFIDGQDNPTNIKLTTGKAIYYGMFLFTNQKVWVLAGQIQALVPKNHDTQKKFINVLPRVFTSKEQSPFSEVDTTSAIYNFLDGFSFTLEEFLTYIDLLRPTHSRLETSASLLYPETTHLGLTYEPGLSTRTQKKLIREAIYMYARRGTVNGLGTYIESLTGLAPTITVSNNLLLTVQDSTFYNSIGGWTATNATLSASLEQVPVTGDNVIDTSYSCKVVASSSGVMSLGVSTPIKKAIPVLGSTQYTISAQVKSPASAGTMTIAIQWFDNQGTNISTSTSTSISANNTWQLKSYTVTSPSTAAYAALKITYSAAGNYYVDQVCLQLGNTVAYDEARAVSMFLDSNKTNYIKNPSFEENATDSWSKTGSVTITQDSSVSPAAYAGDHSAKLVATGNWTFTSNNIPVEKGIYYTMSAYLKNNASLTVKFLGKDSSGTLTGYEKSFTFGAQTDWVRITATDLIDAINETTVAFYDIQFSGSTGTFYLDCIQVEQSPTATDYFDGSLPSNYGAVWESTADNSYTHMYYNKDIKLQRLSQTVSNWLPMNTWWRINSYAGLEYTNLDV